MQQLTSLKINQRAMIINVDHSLVFVKQLYAMGLDIASPIELKYKAPFKGPICVKSNNRLIMIRLRAASQIKVNLL